MVTKKLTHATLVLLSIMSLTVGCGGGQDGNGSLAGDNAFGTNSTPVSSNGGNGNAGGNPGPGNETTVQPICPVGFILVRASDPTVAVVTDNTKDPARVAPAPVDESDLATGFFCVPVPPTAI